MISFFWMQRTHSVENVSTKTAEWTKKILEQKQRIQSFSVHVCDRLRAKGSLSDDDKQILSRLVLLSCFLDFIDQTNLHWLEFSAQFVDDRDDYFFVEYLNKLADVNPAEVGIVFLNLSTNLASYTREEGIKSIVSKLYEKKQKTLADKICNTYFLRGIEFLRGLYEANKQAS